MPAQVGSPIAPESLVALREHGWVVAPDVLSRSEVETTRSAVLRHLPTWEQYASAPDRCERLLGDEWGGFWHFPFPEVEANIVALHPHIHDAGVRFIGTPRVRLLHGSVWGKYAGATHYEQVLHYDYPNHTLVVPRRDEDYGQLIGFVYLTDVTEKLGATRIVSRAASQHLGFVPTHPERDEFPELYEAEVPAVGASGSVLLFTPDVYHRAGRVTAASGMRLTIGFAYGSARCGWQGFQSWPRFGEDPAFVELLVACSPSQRELVGFPAVGDPYWSGQTVAEVGKRYPAMDMRPYEQG